MTFVQWSNNNELFPVSAQRAFGMQGLLPSASAKVWMFPFSGSKHYCVSFSLDQAPPNLYLAGDMSMGSLRSVAVMHNP
jgi:hypothetical protein